MKTHSIGIIGGADGPTAIFATSPALVAGIVAAVVIVACIVIIKMRKK